MIELGKRVTHKINGFTGIATGRAQYLTGCDQYLVTPDELDDKGKVREGHWIDEGQLEVGSQVITADEVSVKQPGGPRSEAPPVR